MASRRAYAFLLVVVVAAVVLSMEGAVAHAARDAPGYFKGAGYLAYPSVYGRARSSMASWLEKLASGPSPKGPGH